MRATLASLVVALGLSTSVYAAGTVRLAIHDGLVDLSATNASIPQILEEWARVGGTRLVNADRLPSAPVTLELDRVPEAQAIDILLRSAAGFIAVPRESASAGSSQYGQILILATSAAPPATAAPAAATSFQPPPPPFVTPPPVRVLPSGATPVLGPDGRPVADDQEGAPSMPPGFSPPSTPPAMIGQPQQASPYGQPVPPYGAPPAQAVPRSAPGAPTGGSAVPGAIIQQQPPRRPGGAN